MDKQIGWFILHEDTEFTNTYECAAWYENVLVKAGRYPIEVPDYKIEDTKWGKEVSGHIDMIGVYLPGIITSDEFGARFYGIPLGSYDNYKNKGKESSYYFRQYLYGVASAILDSEGSLYKSKKYTYELLSEYEAKEINFISDYDGRNIKTWGIFERGR